MVVPEVPRDEGRVDILSPTEQHRSSIQLLNISTEQYGVFSIPNLSSLLLIGQLQSTEYLCKRSCFFFRDRLR